MNRRWGCSSFFIQCSLIQINSHRHENHHAQVRVHHVQHVQFWVTLWSQCLPAATVAQILSLYLTMTALVFNRGISISLFVAGVTWCVWICSECCWWRGESGSDQRHTAAHGPRSEETVRSVSHWDWCNVCFRVCVLVKQWRHKPEKLNSDGISLLCQSTFFCFSHGNVDGPMTCERVCVSCCLSWMVTF